MADQNMASGSTGNAAILLVGPTGSGKTPLGQLIEHRGLGRPRCFGVETKRCLHFDFGANLREAVARGEPDGVLLQKDIDFLARVLAEGLLLEDEHFPVAARILQSFLKRHKADRQTVVVLNGLPRHISQAEAVAALLDVRGVVHLQCSAEVVRRRIESNVGGDRARRVDDARQAVEAKLAVSNAARCRCLSIIVGRACRWSTLRCPQK